MPDGTNAGRAVTPVVTTLAEYKAQQGFVAMRQAHDRGNAGASDILTAVRRARLRGRGGAGTMTADKWQVVLDAVAMRGGPPILVCNAYDADPRSLVASTLLAARPFAALEGIALAAYALGATEAYLYMRSTNQAGYAAVQAALLQMQDANLLAPLTVTLVGVDVGFMGGEESTMLEVIKGRRAMAQQRPPYPAQSGLRELPTAIANLETLLQVPAIMNGAKAYQQTSPNVTTGTKFVSVYDAAGKGQLLEIPFGTTVAAILQQAGINASGETTRGVVVGGPEGGVLPPNLWQTPFDFEPLQKVGTIVGSGTIEVLPLAINMVNWTRDRMAYLAKESCGKCIPCRTGTKRVTGVLEGIMSTVGAKGDLDLLTEFADYIPAASLCGFGWHATHPLKTAMQYYPEDFQRHLDGEESTLPVRTHRFATKGVL